MTNTFHELKKKYKSDRGNLYRYIDYLKKRNDGNLITADIGVWSGWNSYMILEELEPDYHYMIDPYMFYECYTSKSDFGTWNKKGIGTPKSNDDLNEVYIDIVDAFKKYPNTVIVRDFSERYLKHIDDNYFNFIIMEVNTHSHIINTIFDECFRTLKPDGIFAGFPIRTFRTPIARFENEHEGEFTKWDVGTTFGYIKHG